MYNASKRTIYRAVKPPCGKVCPRRQVGCHSHCEDWDKYQKELQAEKDKAREANKADIITADYQVTSVQKTKKGWKKYV